MSITTYAATPGKLTVYRDGKPIVELHLKPEQAMALAREVLRAGVEGQANA